MHVRRLALKATVTLIGGLALEACGGDEPTAPTNPQPTVTVASVVVTPAAHTLVSLGDTIQLTATALDENGDTIIIPVPFTLTTWSSSDETVALVRSNEQALRDNGGALGNIFNWGSATAIAGANGSAIIRATIHGKSADAVITATDVVGAQFVLVNAGADHTCGITTTGAARCWGFLSVVDLGDGFVTPVSLTHTHVAIPGDLTFVSLEAGAFHTCGVSPDGAAYCWGWNSDGQLGNGGFGSPRDTPVPVAGGLTFQSVSAGGTHSCGLTIDGEAYCWGENSVGKLGDGTTANSTTPVAVAGGLTFASVSAGGGHSCGVTTEQKVYCWGFNTNGKLGDGTTDNRAMPVRASRGNSVGLAFASVVTGSHTCGLTTGGVAYCWGGNENGELGDGTTTPRTRPVRVATTLTFTSISTTAGSRTTCAITSDGAAYCWGLGPSTLGNIPFYETWTEDISAGARSTSMPLAVSGGLTFASVAPGWGHTCGLTTGGVVYCWGSADGVGTWRYWREAAIPTPILGQQ